MTELGRQDGEVLTVDLRGKQIDSSDDLWDALREPCGLPDWFGRNLNAWWDTIEAGAISAVLDNHCELVVLVDQAGIFLPGDERGEGFLEVTNRSHYARAELHTV